MAGFDRGLEDITKADHIKLDRADGARLVCLSGQGESSEAILAVALNQRSVDLLEFHRPQVLSPHREHFTFLDLGARLL